MDFSYLNTISDGDMDFVKQFISTFESNTQKIVANMKAAFDNGSKDDLKKLAHQLKPSLQMLELETLQVTIDIQDDPEAASAESIEAIAKECEEAVAALKAEYGV